MTRVISGVGSGISGEKEIYNTFYIRFLSARPVREAYARIQQINHGYDEDVARSKRGDSRQLSLPILISMPPVDCGFGKLPLDDPNEESSVRRFFQSETARRF